MEFVLDVIVSMSSPTALMEYSLKKENGRPILSNTKIIETVVIEAAEHDFSKNWLHIFESLELHAFFVFLVFFGVEFDSFDVEGLEFLNHHNCGFIFSL